MSREAFSLGKYAEIRIISEKSIGCGLDNPIGAFRRKADYRYEQFL